MIEKHLLKLRARDQLSEEEEQAIRGAVAGTVKVPADELLVRARELQDSSKILLKGVACRQKDLRSGARQITELHVAGDFVDLHSFSLKRLDHDVRALSDCTFATVPHDALR